MSVLTYSMLPIVTYYIFVFQTLLNQRTTSRPEPLYLASILPAYLVMISMGVIAFVTAGGTLDNIKAALTCKASAKYEIE